MLRQPEERKFHSRYGVLRKGFALAMVAVRIFPRLQGASAALYCSEHAPGLYDLNSCTPCKL